MGPKNACSYADLAMGVIDEKARTEGPVKPKYWWRYRDDIVDIWPHGLPKLYEFTDFINSLYPTIRFTLVYSNTSLNVLDVTINLDNGFLSTDVYAKPTDSHLYLPYNSSHPIHTKNSIPYGVALRLRRICSSQDTYNHRSEEYKQYLRNQNYDLNLINKQFQRVHNLPRDELLCNREKIATPRKCPLVLDYNPILPDISKILRKHSHLLSSNPALKEIFPVGSIIPAYRRTKNLKELVSPSKLKDLNTINVEEGAEKYSRCDKKCDLCRNYSHNSLISKSTVTGRSYQIKENITCTTMNVIYLITCTKCHVQYVGSTSTEFKVRFRNHKSAMLTKKNCCEVATHFNQSCHSLTDFTFLAIERITNSERLLDREIYWTAQLRTMKPFGLNKRNELKSKNRIAYNN